MSRPTISIPLSRLAESQSPETQRNISNPYSLAIPPRSQQRTTYQRADTPTQYLEPPDRPSAKKGTPYLEIPTATIVVTEHPSPYTLNDASRSTLARSHAPDKQKKQKKKLNDRVLAFAITLSLTILVAITLPLAIILPTKLIKPLPIKILVPFYLNPELGSWRRLEDSIIKHHDLPFTLILSPSHGPGNATWPAATYIDAVERVSMYPNVRTVGYIDTANGTVPNTTVRAQAATYAGWRNVSEEMDVRGVYFDRAPSAEGEGYLRNVSGAVRGWGGGEGEAGLVVVNTGRVPVVNSTALEADITVVFEGAYVDLPAREELSMQLAELKGARERYAMLVHSVPKDLGRGGLRRIVERVRRDVEWLYVTDLTEDVYSGYPSFWEDWLDVTW
ncbi:Spherulation-specific family 4-domain-containing protein [Ampelomyces quisqualis]|uniref:Spherulation-specific family 4-domain-containing protein n=1 Tax=Ampelomyces quisqualis TaxID=50730 RepID=A0A6A5QYK3_AMPQU|nr:Spherulation-specific family 4-domain-containing protein [Ampelomyces quisqualis]